MEKSKVYALPDDSGCVTRIDGGYTERNIDASSGWVLIDEGYGTRYNLCQENYLSMPLTDYRGVYRYKLVDGVVVQRTQAEMDADYAARPAPEPTTVERLSALEATTDDIILMMADMIGG